MELLHQQGFDWGSGDLPGKQRKLEALQTCCQWVWGLLGLTVCSHPDKGDVWEERKTYCWSVTCSHTLSSPPLLQCCSVEMVPPGKGAWQLSNSDPFKHCCPMQHTWLLLRCCPCPQLSSVAAPAAAEMCRAEVHPNCALRFLLLVFSHSWKPMD